MTEAFVIEPFSAPRDRRGFTSGVEPLDVYFRERVGQEVRRRATSCYVVIDAMTDTVAGFYTLAMAGVRTEDLPVSMVRRLPRYPALPVARLGRLAVDRRFQGRKLGSVLLADAFLRVSRSDIAAVGMIVDAKDLLAVAFYRHHGFEPLAGDGMRLVASWDAMKPS